MFYACFVWSNMFCARFAGECDLSEEFECNNLFCVKLTTRCDGDNDCGDMSDELNCHNGE